MSIQGKFRSEYRKNGRVLFVYGVIASTPAELDAFKDAQLKQLGKNVLDESGQPLMHVAQIIGNTRNLRKAVIDIGIGFKGDRVFVDSSKTEMARDQRLAGIQEAETGKLLALAELGIDIRALYGQAPVRQQAQQTTTPDEKVQTPEEMLKALEAENDKANELNKENIQTQDLDANLGGLGGKAPVTNNAGA